ncbi:MAG: Nucleoside-diphosphate-sugar epimerase [uncultured bacterium]|nr:MAG: Nucleoside-diphosphate-sugar epimerase [uncultured bacterium]
MEGKTLLISGGAGFLGSYIVATISLLNTSLFKSPCRVIVVDNYITGKRKRDLESLDDKNIEFITHDITKPIIIDKTIDYIIHAAGLASPVYYRKFPLETIEAAIFGAKNLLELARKKKVKSFLFFSSSEIYGDPDPNFIPTPETYRGNVSPIGSRACYDESKRLGETISITYFDKYKVPVKIVRPFNVYGPGMRPDDYRVIPTFLMRALERKPLPVHDEGNQTRTFCYISDATTAFLKVLLSHKSGEVYNVGSDDDEINMMSLAQIVADVSPKKVEIKRIPYPENYPKDEPRRRRPDLSKIKNILNYRTRVSLRTGLARTLRWFASQLEKQ